MLTPVFRYGFRLFDDCVISLSDGRTLAGMEWTQIHRVVRNGEEIKEVYYSNIQNGDIIDGVSVTSIQKIGRNITFEEFSTGAKKGRLKNLRAIGKGIGLSFLFGASANNLAGGTLRMAWNPKMCADFIRERKLEDLQKQIAQSNKRLQGDDLLYYVVAFFFRSEFFKLYPGLEKWIFDCAKIAASNVMSPQ